MFPALVILLGLCCSLWRSRRHRTLMRQEYDAANMSFTNCHLIVLPKVPIWFPNVQESDASTNAQHRLKDDYRSTEAKSSIVSQKFGMIFKSFILKFRQWKCVTKKAM